eukprot:14258923-Ditylum_brightwellii.AAC.1
MSNLAYYEKFRNLIEVAEEHGANLCLHPKLINTKAADVESPMDEEKDMAKDKFQGRMFIIKACQSHYQKLKEELHNGLTQGRNGLKYVGTGLYNVVRKKGQRYSQE